MCSRGRYRGGADVLPFFLLSAQGLGCGARGQNDKAIYYLDIERGREVLGEFMARLRWRVGPVGGSGLEAVRVGIGLSRACCGGGGELPSIIN